MGNDREKIRNGSSGTAQLKRRRRIIPIIFLPLLALAIFSGYSFYESARSETLGGVIEARKQSPEVSPNEDEDQTGVAGYSSAKAVDQREKDTMRSDAGDRKLKLSAQNQATPPANTCNDLMVMVNRENHLPSGYAPPDLVPIEAYGVPVYGNQLMLREGATEQLSRMSRAATAAGEEIVVSSAYRSFYQQRFAFARLVSIYGEKRARLVSAPPGQSQHQLGTAVDFTNSFVGFEIHKAFGRTTASAWLLENAPEYGFVLSYPNHKEAETGYRWEPWHYRYIGVENARSFQEGGVTLQAFLSREGIKPRC